MVATTSGRARMKAFMHSVISGYFFTSSLSKTVAAHSGTRPTIDRTFSRLALPSGSRCSTRAGTGYGSLLRRHAHRLRVVLRLQVVQELSSTYPARATMSVMVHGCAVWKYAR